MRFSTGVDIEENHRFENKLDDKNFLERIFTQAEIEYCLSKKNSHEHLTARFCAKEAVIKAMSSFYGETVSINLNKIEVIKESKIPEIKIYNEKFQNLKFSLSISHCKTHSIAQVLCFEQN